MDDLNEAMVLELEIERCYRRLADVNEHTAMALVFNLLADEAVKHYEWLRRVYCGERREEGETGSVREPIAHLFRRMMDEGVDVPDDASLVHRYRMVQAFEDQAVAHYARMAAQAESDAMKESFRGMVAEDILHRQVLESVIQFVTEPVYDGWLEKAKWLSDDPD